MLRGLQLQQHAFDNEEEMSELAYNYCKALKEWSRIAKKNWNEMVQRHNAKGKAGDPKFLWANKGPISDKFTSTMEASQDWFKQKGKGSETEWFDAVLSHVEEQIKEETKSSITPQKLRIKYQDWRNGGAYWNQSAEAAKAKREKSDKPVKKRPKQEEQEEMLIPERDPLSYGYHDPTRSAMRMRLYDLLAGNIGSNTPAFSALTVFQNQLTGEPSPQQSDKKTLLHPSKWNSTVVGSLLNKYNVSEVIKGEAPTDQNAAKWLKENDAAAKTMTLEVPDKVAEVVEKRCKGLTKEQLESLMAVPEPESATPSDYDSESSGSTCESSLPEVGIEEFQWGANDLDPTHSLQRIVGRSIKEPPSHVNDQLSRTQQSVTPPSWHEYLLATSIEFEAFKQYGGRSKQYSDSLNKVRKELAVRNSSLRKKLIRHKISPEKLVKSKK